MATLECSDNAETSSYSSRSQQKVCIIPENLHTNVLSGLLQLTPKSFPLKGEQICPSLDFDSPSFSVFREIPTKKEFQQKLDLNPCASDFSHPSNIPFILLGDESGFSNKGSTEVYRNAIMCIDVLILTPANTASQRLCTGGPVAPFLQLKARL